MGSVAHGAKSDWKIAGFVGYEYSRTVTFFGGYRYLAVNYDRDGYEFDVVNALGLLLLECRTRTRQPFPACRG